MNKRIFMKSAGRVFGGVIVSAVLLPVADLVQGATLLAAWEFDAGDVSGSSVSASGGSAANHDRYVASRRHGVSWGPRSRWEWRLPPVWQ